jgi:hypothetical protein
VGPKVSGLTYKSRAKWKMLRGIYSAIYGDVNVSVCVEIKGDYIEKYQNCFISVTLKSWSGRKILDPRSYTVVVCSVGWVVAEGATQSGRPTGKHGT